ncbi:hypothetical protein EVAR_22265_1 [Eumeta japonica]|uniref:Uncharacterized protein n=1 Tax=Eumeta variegata TaxID=151549 RepID=A0A4C1UBS8_EUMVA|nr:hypothetical protein EVAR_22265_1 [Eumeta japonica]
MRLLQLNAVWSRTRTSDGCFRYDGTEAHFNKALIATVDFAPSYEAGHTLVLRTYRAPYVFRVRDRISASARVRASQKYESRLLLGVGGYGPRIGTLMPGIEWGGFRSDPKLSRNAQ